MKRTWLIEFTHGQFALGDADALWETEPGTPAAQRDRVAESPEWEGFTVLTARYGRYARVELELAEVRPALPFDGWDHVVESHLVVPSGRIDLSTPAGNTAYSVPGGRKVSPSLALPRGTYGVLILVGNLAAVTRRLSEADDRAYAALYYGKTERPSPEELAGLDHYRLILWPVAVGPLTVLKRFQKGPQVRRRT